MLLHIFNLNCIYCRIAGGCSHLPALFYTLSSMIVHGFKDVPGELSCTSLPQQWGKPRGRSMFSHFAFDTIILTDVSLQLQVLR